MTCSPLTTIAMAQTFTLPDGRRLDYKVSGATEGDAVPLVFIHGTPGAYTPLPGFPDLCKKKGIKLVTLSRAGYGGSSRNRGRLVVDNVADIQALKEHLGLDKCLVGGWSGGGPLSLACAARLPGCVAALCVAGVAPYNAEGLDWLEGQGQDNVDEFNASLRGEAELAKFCSAQKANMLQADAAGIIEVLSSLLPDVDKRALREQPAFGRHIVESFHEGLKLGVEGWVDDDLAFVEPWGFSLDEIKVPVLLYQGSEDKMVPFGHGRWLADQLPQGTTTVHLVDGEGHISIFLGQEEKILDVMLAAFPGL
ncbi:Alpha/Beta hydrolase protein [Mycena pura]|uniref:Alpha/Beta hydrolase protein n=1 Tax=Mycena pura TaxID=153505 RepID=A0AAD6YCM5_9AGAR|nr:Alpha/Beta hydrolase protein [Mycena pura]